MNLKEFNLNIMQYSTGMLLIETLTKSFYMFKAPLLPPSATVLEKVLEFHR